MTQKLFGEVCKQMCVNILLISNCQIYEKSFKTNKLLTHSVVHVYICMYNFFMVLYIES